MTRRAGSARVLGALLVVGTAAGLLAAGMTPASGGTSAPPSGGTLSSTTGSTPSCTVSVPVLVVGGTPAGVAAAMAAGRLGSKVLITEARPYLGGDLTGPMLNMFDMDYGPGGIHLARGVFMDIFSQLGLTFDVELAKLVFLQEVRREPNITLRLLTKPVQVLVQDSRVTGVVFKDLQAHERLTVCAKRVVDATDDADIAAMAGVPYYLGREGSGIDRAMMTATLVFEVDGVNWNDVVAYVTTKPRPRTGHPRGGVYRGNIWGFSEIMREYRPSEQGTGIYDLNLGRQANKTILINGLLLYGVDGTDPASVADGMRRGHAELVPLMAYLRSHIAGFQNAELVRTADFLYIRETRHIRGLYTLTVHDIVDSRVFWDAVGVASYPIDLHPYKSGEFNPYAAQRYVYTIPLRALIPLGLDNVLVASRSISATYEAAGSARVVPTTMEEGQAAGVAAVLSIQARTNFSKFSQTPALVHELQETLTTPAQGAYLLPETVAAAAGSVPPPWASPSHGGTTGSEPSRPGSHTPAPPFK
jgi:hypothetical protein